MPYPPAPWSLKGYCVQTLHLVDTARARQFVPPDLRVVSVLPGKTLGVVYFASYGPGSAMEYDELIVAPALTRHAGRLGFWISHIYVDHPDSVAGGREIWGLPKEMAQFAWETGSKDCVVARQGDRVLATVSWGKQRRLWQQPLRLPVISRLGPQVLGFQGKVCGRLGISRGKLEVPGESPFASLRLGGGGLAYQLRNMDFVASAPVVLDQAPVPAH